MSSVRTIDLAQKPDPQQEFRLQREDCVVSIWLPARMSAVGQALEALQSAGFEKPDE